MDTLHLKAPGNWINDPNGFIYYKGKYHLFYQYFPYAPVWGTMHWGHAVSGDLVHWEHVGVALFPTKYGEQNGCFSGSAVEHEGKMNLYYTGIRYREINAENIHFSEKDYESVQFMISSEDGYTFDNFNGKKVIIPAAEDTRDPKVWREDGVFYMVLGGTCRGEKGSAVFYRSEDGVNWRYMSRAQSGRLGKRLECPDLFRVGKGYVLIGSAMYLINGTGDYEHQTVCMPVDFDTERCRLNFHKEYQKEYQYVDYGLDLYAPQTNVDAEGRRVMIAWMRMPKAVNSERGIPWNGMMCLPRVVEYADGHIYFRVHPAVERYFEKEIPVGEGAAADKKNAGIAGVMPGVPIRIRVTLAPGESLDIGGFRIWEENDLIRTDRSGVFADVRECRMICNTPKLNGRYKLDIFVEPNLIEVFINDGEYVISNVVYGLGGLIRGRVEKISAGA